MNTSFLPYHVTSHESIISAVVDFEDDSSYYASHNDSGLQYEYIIERVQIGNETLILGYLYARAEVTLDGLNIIKVLLTLRDGTEGACPWAVDCMNTPRVTESLEKLVFSTSLDNSTSSTNCTYFRSHEIYSTFLLTCTIPPSSEIDKVTKELSLSVYEKKTDIHNELDRNDPKETIYLQKILLHLRRKPVAGKTTICSVVSHNREEESAVELFHRILIWWQYHRQLGFHRLYLYLKVTKILEMTRCHLTFFQDLGVFIVNGTIESDIASELDRSYKERPYFDQQAMLSHCWQHNYNRADWIFNIDIDEFLILPNGSQNVTHFLASLLLNEVPVGRLNLPRIPYRDCAGANVSKHGRSNKPMKYNDLRSSLNFCRGHKGFISQKYAFRPALIELPSIHVADISVGAKQSGLFVDNLDNYDETFGEIDNVSFAVIGHIQFRPYEEMTVLRHMKQDVRYLFDTPFWGLISEIDVQAVKEVIDYIESNTSSP